MKYLKSIYESSEDDFTQDIKEILLEVEDIGYKVEVDEDEDSDGPYNYVLIEHSSRILCDIYEIKDCLLRLKDYMGDRYIKCSIFQKRDNPRFSKWYDIDLTEDIEDFDGVTQIVIYYKKYIP